MKLTNEQIKVLKESNIKTKNFSFKDKEFYGKIVKIYDGDTFIINITYSKKLIKVKCRLSRIDTAELNTDNGKKVKEILQNLLLNKIILLKCGNYDKYGRILGEINCKTDNNKIININDFIVENNLGVKYGGNNKENNIKFDKKIQFIDYI